MEVGAAVGRDCGKLFDANPALLELSRLCSIGSGTEDKNITLNRISMLDAFEQARFQRQAQARIQYYAQQGPAPGMVTAVGEQRIVSKDGPGADHNCVMLVPQLVNMRAPRGAGNPTGWRSARGAIELLRWRGGNLSIK